jgi:predicted nucleic acid-binding protein
MLRTFLDAGVLIAAARSAGVDRERALRVLDDPGRIFLTSAFVYLEVIPKTVFFDRPLERTFYERYFSNAVWFTDLKRIETTARHEAAKCGLGAMDALHLAAAHLSRADEFVTTEKPEKAVHRCELIKVVYVFG